MIRAQSTSCYIRFPYKAGAYLLLAREMLLVVRHSHGDTRLGKWTTEVCLSDGHPFEVLDAAD